MTPQVRRARRVWRRGLGCVAAVLALALAAMTSSSASQLVLAGGQGYHVSSHERCDGDVAATATPTGATASSIDLSGIAAACSGLTIVVRVYDPVTGATRATGSATAPAGGGTRTVSTAPAFTPSPSDKVYVTIASWPLVVTWSFSPPLPICGVYRLVNGVETARPGTCAVTGLSAQWWGTTGSRKANVNIAFSYTGASYPDFFKFTVDLSTATGLPGSWSWTTSGTAGGNLVVAPSYRCSSLPVLSGSSMPSWGPTAGFQFQLVEDRASQAVTCAP